MVEERRKRENNRKQKTRKKYKETRKKKHYVEERNQTKVLVRKTKQKSWENIDREINDRYDRNNRKL